MMICGAESGTNYGIKGSLGSQDTFFFILVHFFFNLYFLHCFLVSSPHDSPFLFLYWCLYMGQNSSFIRKSAIRCAKGTVTLLVHQLFASWHLRWNCKRASKNFPVEWEGYWTSKQALYWVSWSNSCEK